ncbi:MAG: DUF3108 domain-containing protein [bacterium]|nr:DUF3108 domain-containing protein [bacterium]
MKKNKLLISVLFFLTFTCTAGNYGKEYFCPGQKLVYDITWKGIKVGKTIFYVKGLMETGGHKTYHIVSETYSTGIADLFFKVRDLEETFIDIENYYSWRYIKDINEGKSHSKGEYIFDSGRKTVITPGGKYFIPSDCQDPLSVLIYLRFLKLNKDESINLNYVTDRGIKTLDGKVLGEEIINVPSGRFETKAVEFYIRSGGSNQLRLSSGTWIWFAYKNGTFPVQVKFKTKYGYIKCQLKEYTTNIQ